MHHHHHRSTQASNINIVRKLVLNLNRAIILVDATLLDLYFLIYGTNATAATTAIRAQLRYRD